MKKISLLLLLSSLLLAGNFSVRAQTGTPSGNLEEDLNGEIESIRSAVKDAVAEKLKSITQTNQKLALSGTITQINQEENILELSTFPQSKTKKISFLPSEITIIDQSRQKINFEDLKIDQVILVMGYQNSPDSLDAKRIIVIEPLQELSKVSLGQVADYSQTTNTILLIPLADKDAQLELSLDKASKIYLKKNAEINSAPTSFKIAKGQTILAVYKKKPENGSSVLAQKILILAENEETTPSSSPSPTISE